MYSWIPQTFPPTSLSSSTNAQAFSYEESIFLASFLHVPFSLPPFASRELKILRLEITKPAARAAKAGAFAPYEGFLIRPHQLCECF
jgi:hypothetical protein